MSSSILQIDGVQITTPAEYLRYLDLTEGANRDELTTRSPDDVRKKIKSHEPIKLSITSRMTALIIGINTYKNQGISRLKGAVADANAIKQYLMKTLKIPELRIKMLTEENATRKNIVDAFMALEHDREINYGDAILIYYAGHGQQVKAPDGWATENVENKIQSIVPHDFDGQGIHVIPDYTLGFLIYKISQRRGDNITVIFDCCHAGSGTRQDDPDHMARTAYLDSYSIPIGLDVDLGCHPGEPDGSRSTTPLSGPSLSSHVLLAACSATESAREMNGRGKFTVSLEAALKTVSPDQISYVELLDRLDNITGQNPQLEGNNRHRIVFNAKAAVPAHYPYKIHLNEFGNYVLHAGAADGVCKGAQFTVYATYSSIFKDSPLGTMVAETVKSFETITRTLEHSALDLPLNSPAYAVQTRAGEKAALKVYMTMTEDLMPAFTAQLLQQKDPGSNQYNISPVQDPSIADLELQRDGDKFSFLILDPTVRQYDMTECIHKAPVVAEDLRPVLQGAAHYYYHLRRSSPNSDIAKHIEIEFFKLENTGKYDLSVGGLGRPLRKPVGDNLVKNGTISLNIADNDNTVYGLLITNRGNTDLYPSLFYFDNSELSINSYYKSAGPSTNFDVDSPLKKEGGKLTIGFGDGGGTAFEYYIPDERDVDVGFLKCFFSTVPVDLSKVQQESPFKSSRALKQTMVRIPRTWDCITIPVVQRRVK